MQSIKNTTLQDRTGFSLIEILISLAIVMVLVGMALPSLQSAATDAKETALKQQLQCVRTAVEFYVFQHNQENPGMDPSTASWSAKTFVHHLMLASDLNGFTASAGTTGYPYGPYMFDGFPENPINQLNTVLLVNPGSSFTNADESTGWVYWAETGEFRANCIGKTSEGEPLFEL
ncbi:MAG: type II secretion system GspH family protein [Planctomycetes bacterium]|nr:type II secretion system GspH family protein [Planctomycetota bacterium]